MKWIVVKRNYHGEEAAAMVRWVVGVEGQTRGICECWDEDSAQKIAFFLNIAPAMYRHIADALNNWYPLSELECSEKECAARGRLFEFFRTLEKMDENLPGIGNENGHEKHEEAQK